MTHAFRLRFTAVFVVTVAKPPTMTGTSVLGPEAILFINVTKPRQEQIRGAHARWNALSDVASLK